MTFDLNKFKSRRPGTNIKYVVEDGQQYAIRNGEKFAVETLNPGSTPPKTKREEFELKFVGVPQRWIETLRGSSGGVYELALAILAEDFQRKRLGGEIVLSAKMTGMARTVRHRAAKELEQLGLIKLSREGKNALKVKIV